MSTAATQQQLPVVPPRPSKGQERDQANVPKIPPRPIKRGLSPNPDRYAPSPLNGGIPPKKDRSNSSNSLERTKSVEIPAVVGEEGMEYAAYADQLASSSEPSTSPEQTRTVGENMKIHAPKATMPAQSAKQRIAQVTRTDSDRAAAFGIGKPSGESPLTPSSRSLKKKASTASGLSQSELEDDEHGIPEIGQQVPLLAFAGDVQAPSPAPGAHIPGETSRPNHKRKNSSRGLPPGSYGLHGHNVDPQDKLGRDYYKKHPELLKLEHHPYQHDRATNFSMSSEQLNKMVRDTETNSQGVGKLKQMQTWKFNALTDDVIGTSEHTGTPSEQAAWAVYSEATSRSQSTKPQEGASKRESEPEIIVVDEPNRRRSVLFSDEAIPAPPEDEVESDYRAPILAEDEVRKNTPRPDQVPAVELSRERRGSDYEMEPPRSRPSSRPGSLYKVDSSEMRSTPLEDVIEYEPLFPDDDEEEPTKHLTAAQIKEMKQRFPSRDIWEDAPDSVHYSAEVSTPDLTEEEIRKVPSREQTETPAHAFARKQEELAEKEHTHPDAFLWRTQKPTWVNHQPHLSKEAAVKSNAPDPSSRSNSASRFPSRDVWEDTPDSLQLETEVSGPQMEDTSPVDAKPQVPDRPQRKVTDPKDKPVIPERLKPKSPEETATKPVIPDRPKPQIPARPAKSSPSGDAPAPKAKPAVPARPMGNKIAALQAGFMGELNKKLGLGPQAPKPKEEVQEEVAEEPKEKAPLSDARKGRARGPQRRAPAAAAPPAVAVAAKPAAEKPKLTFASTVTIWSIDPDTEGGALLGDVESLATDSKPSEVPVVEAPKEEVKEAAPAENTKSELETELTEPATESEARAEEAKVAEEVVELEEEHKKEEEPIETKTKTLTTSKLKRRP